MPSAKPAQKKKKQEKKDQNQSKENRMSAHHMEIEVECENPEQHQEPKQSMNFPGFQKRDASEFREELAYCWIILSADSEDKPIERDKNGRNQNQINQGKGPP